jgi:hypothetical protein
MSDHDLHNLKSPQFDDDVLIAMYVEYDIPRDSLIGDSSMLLSFVEDYINRTGHQVNTEQLTRRLFALGKRGEAKGGLPKLRRKYQGRN